MWSKLFGRKNSEPAAAKPELPAAQPAHDSIQQPTEKAPTALVEKILTPWEREMAAKAQRITTMTDSLKRSVRRKAAIEIGKIYRKREQYLPMLIQLADDSDRHVRVAALRSMTHLNTGEMPAILKALSDPQLGVRQEAVRAMRYYSECAPQLISILTGQDRPLHHLAAAALEMQKGESVVSALIVATKRPYTTSTRRKAARALARRHAARGVAPLLEGIGDANPNIRAEMALRLRQLILTLPLKHHETAIEALKAGLTHDSPAVQLNAAYHLARLHDPAGTPVLVNALLDMERPPYLTRELIQEALNHLR